MRPGAIPGSSLGDEPADLEPSTSDSDTKSGTRTHPATIAMREGLRGEANEMVQSILAAVLGSAEMWSRDVIEVRISLAYIAYPFGARGIRQCLPCVFQGSTILPFVPWSPHGHLVSAFPAATTCS